MIRDKYPEKQSLCAGFLQKEHWTALDVIQVNDLLIGKKKNKADVKIDQKHRSYDPQSIRQILRYQQKNNLNNNEVANKFSLSRNTIAKWKRLFPELCVSDE